jgi:lipoprotein-anchoring transpeptidase ErfK/SrfK
MGRGSQGMRQRKHVARSRFGWVPLTLGFAAVLVLLLGGAAFAGFRYDQSASTRVLPGVRIHGINVGEMTRAQALQAIQPAADRILDRDITVEAAGKTWQTTPRKLGTRVDVERAVDEAVSLSDSLSWPSRLYHRLLNKSVNEQIALPITYRKGPVASFVAKVARAVAVSPRDASLDVVEGEVVKVRSAEGQGLRKGRAEKAVLGALRAGRSSIELTVRTVAPSVSDEDLGETIIVRVGENRLYLYRGFSVVKTYSVATGQPEYPTPLGHFQIVNKRINPTWVNPALDTWGAGSPAYIPPGPDNPLGTRALDISAPGIRIHGTPDDDSIGTYASHGCIRMHIPESEELFGLVEIGTPVIIVA